MANHPDYEEDDLSTGADCAGLVTCETLRRVMPRQLTEEERLYEDAMQEVIAITPMMSWAIKEADRLIEARS